MTDRRGVIGVFAPQYGGSTDYYAAMSRCDIAVIDTGMRADRRFKSAHRCEIECDGGTTMLTCGINRFASGARWDEVMLSTHGRWWEIHLSTLATNYGPSPYCSFILPYFERILDGRVIEEGISVSMFDLRVDAVIRRLLGISPQPGCDVLASALAALREGGTVITGGREYDVRDYRRPDSYAGMSTGVYMQPWREPYRDGAFTPGLSVIDLLMCGGELMGQVGKT